MWGSGPAGHSPLSVSQGPGADVQDESLWRTVLGQRPTAAAGDGGFEGMTPSLREGGCAWTRSSSLLTASLSADWNG